MANYCEFIGGDCIKEKCAAFQKSRAMTQQEIERYNAADIPVIDPYIYNWCLKYNRQIRKVVYVFRSV